MHHVRIGNVREVEARKSAFYLMARQRVADAGAMTLVASKAISGTALPPDAWNGDGASARASSNCSLNAACILRCFKTGRLGADYVKIENPV